MTRSRTTRSRVFAVAAATAGSLALGAGVVAGLTGASAADNPTLAAPTAALGPNAAGPNGNGLGVGPGGRGFGRGHGMGLGHRLGLDEDTAALAKKLGVTEAKLKAALVKVRADLRPDKSAKPPAGTRPDPATMDQKLADALAKELGISSDKVLSVLKDVRATHEAERTQEFEARLDQAVTDGKLTRAEADAVLKAAKAGVIGMGGPHHP
jgi:hypothetical protein